MGESGRTAAHTGTDQHAPPHCLLRPSAFRSAFDPSLQWTFILNPSLQAWKPRFRDLARRVDLSGCPLASYRACPRRRSPFGCPQAKSGGQQPSAPRSDWGPHPCQHSSPHQPPHMVPDTQSSSGHSGWHPRPTHSTTQSHHPQGLQGRAGRHRRTSQPRPWPGRWAVPAPTQRLRLLPPQFSHL